MRIKLMNGKYLHVVGKQTDRLKGCPGAIMLFTDANGVMNNVLLTDNAIKTSKALQQETTTPLPVV